MTWVVGVEEGFMGFKLYYPPTLLHLNSYFLKESVRKKKNKWEGGVYIFTLWILAKLFKSTGVRNILY